MRLSKLLRFVEGKTGATANIEAVHPAFLSSERLRLDPDQHVHSGDFCRKMKLEGNFRTCHANKQRSLEVAGRGRSFCGVCPNGVWEAAWPVTREGALAAVLYLGHFRPGGEKGKNPGLEKLPPVDEKKKGELRRWGGFVARFMEVELELLASEQPGLFKRRKESDFASQCAAFIDRNYTEDVALSDFAKILRVNPNYLSGVVHRATGKTFRRLLSEKRVREAETYLRLHKALSITEIAGLCGFHDGNYFSVVFKKITGLTPRQCRGG